MNFFARKAKQLFLFSTALSLLILPACNNTSRAKGDIAKNDSGASAASKKAAGKSTSGNADPMALPADISDTEMMSLDGKTFKLSDFKGKVVLVNMWATWCGFCKKEMPDLVELSKEFKDRDVEFIGLNVDNEKLPQVENFVSQYEVPYRIGWTNDDIYDYFQPQGIPSTYIITRDGSRLYWAINGATSQQRIRTKLEEALNDES